LAQPPSCIFINFKEMPMIPSDVKATLSFSDGSPSMELPLYKGSVGPDVIDIRNAGLIGAVELAPIPGAPTARAFQAFLDAYDKAILIRTTGDIIALSPPLIISKAEIDELIGKLGDVLKGLK